MPRRRKRLFLSLAEVQRIAIILFPEGTFEAQTSDDQRALPVTANA